MIERREKRLEEVARWAHAQLEDAMTGLRLGGVMEHLAVPMQKPPVMTPTERDMRIVETRQRIAWIDAALVPDSTGAEEA